MASQDGAAEAWGSGGNDSSLFEGMVLSVLEPATAGEAASVPIPSQSLNRIPRRGPTLMPTQPPPP